MIYSTVLSYGGMDHADFPVHWAFSHEAVLKFVKYFICMGIIMCWFFLKPFFLKVVFIIYFLAVLGRCCCAAFSSVAVSGGYSLVAVRQLLIVVVSLVEHRLWGMWASVVVASGLWSTGSVVMVRGLICSEACGIFPDQRSNLWLLHWQEGSSPLSMMKMHDASPYHVVFVLHSIDTGLPLWLSW